jgi:hypothetical protein
MTQEEARKVVAPAVISAGAAVVGTAMSLGNAAHSGGGFTLNAQGANYPREIQDDQLVGERTHLPVRDVIKFKANGWIYDDDLAVSMGGFASSTRDPVVGYAEGPHPNIPANRFVNVHFAPGGRSDTLSIGHLDVTITPYERVMEPADNPKILFNVSGRWDPAGPGDSNYSFEMMIDCYGNVSLGSASSSQAEISCDGSCIQLYMDQVILDGTSQ